jgi:hypothetical protein
VYANGHVALAEGLSMLKLGQLQLVGGWSYQAHCPLRKELWLDGCLGIEPREGGITLA